MRFFTIFLVAVMTCLIQGCTPTVKVTGPLIKKIDAEELSRLVINFSTKMKIEKHLELEDSWAAYDDYIDKICLRYSSQRLLTVYDARLLMVELVEEFLYRLNNHTVLSFELDHFPFTADDLDVRINFESFAGVFIDNQYVGLTWLQAGCVHYYAFNRKNIDIDWSHQRFEPYFKSKELALLKRQADLPFIEKRDVEKPPKKPNTFLYDRYTPSLYH